MATNYVAAVDGVLLRVGDRVVSLYRDGGVPQGADKAHVKLLVERGLLVETEVPDAPADDPGEPEQTIDVPAKSATRAEWDAYAKTQGLTDEEIASYSSKEELQKHFGVE